jgi:nitroreductase
MMELREAILKRRSIRGFTDYYVTDDELKEVIQAARWAPSWANTQTWSFIVARDKEIIEKIAGTYPEFNPARKCSISASAIIVVCAKKGVAGCREGRDITILQNWFMFDSGLAVQNLCLKAHELGLGTVIVGMLNHNELKNALSIPDDYEAIVAIPIGKPIEKDKKAPPRNPVDKILFLDKFGEPFIK